MADREFRLLAVGHLEDRSFDRFGVALVFVEVDELPESVRGEGGFGSTGVATA